MSSSDGNEEVTRRKSSKNTIPPSYIPQGDPNTSCHCVEHTHVCLCICLCMDACMRICTVLYFTVFIFIFYFILLSLYLLFFCIKMKSIKFYEPAIIIQFSID